MPKRTEKTIKEVTTETGLSRYTLAHAAKGGLMGKSARQSGATWMIDTAHADFKGWLEAHEQWKQVRTKKQG